MSSVRFPSYVEVQKIFDPGNIESEIRKKNNERKEMSTEKASLKSERNDGRKKKKIESAERISLPQYMWKDSRAYQT